MDSIVTCNSSNQRADVYEATLSWSIHRFNTRHRYSKVFELTLPKSDTKLKFVVEIESSERKYRRVSLPVYKFICNAKSELDKWQFSHKVVIRSKFGHVIDARREFSKLTLDQSHRSNYFINEGNVFRCLKDGELTILIDVSIKRAQLPTQLDKHLAVLPKPILDDDVAAVKDAVGEEPLESAAEFAEFVESAKPEAKKFQEILNEEPEAAEEVQESSELTVKQDPADSTYDSATDMSLVEEVMVVSLEETISEGTDPVAAVTESLEHLNLEAVKEKLQPDEGKKSDEEDQPIKTQEEPGEVLESSIGPKDVDQDNLDTAQEAEATPTQIQAEILTIKIQEVVETSDNATEVEKSEALDQHEVVNAPEGQGEESLQPEEPQAPAADSTGKSARSTEQQSPQAAKRIIKSSDKKSKKAKSSPRMKRAEAAKNGVPNGGAEPAAAIEAATEATEMKDGE